MDEVVELVVVVSIGLPLRAFENFLSKGLACCCSSVNTGFWATTRAWMLGSSENRARNYTPLC